ncbi:MAG: hypothetical protein ACI4JZ_09290, partial [Oscillospiraceae bacterium]
ETVYDGSPETFDVVLTPMMAAKWLEDNTNPRPAAAPVNNDEKKAAAEVAPTNPADRKDAPNVPDKHPTGKDGKTAPLNGGDIGSVEM